MKNLIMRIRIYFLQKKADRLHKIDGLQYFIVPYNFKGKTHFRLMNKRTHDAYNRICKKQGLRQLSYVDLLKIAIYKTSQGTLSRR